MPEERKKRKHQSGSDKQPSPLDFQQKRTAPTASDNQSARSFSVFVPSSSSHRDPNRAPTEVAPSTPVPPEEAAPSIPATPKFDPDHGGSLPEEPAIGLATRVEAKDGVTQMPPLLSRLIQDQ